MQHAEVAELNRRAQHAEQESAAARAEVTAVRQAAAQQQAERAIAQYAHVGRLTGLPYREAQSAREYEPLPSVGPDRWADPPLADTVLRVAQALVHVKLLMFRRYLWTWDH